jgi:hypothetical protein
MSLVTTSLVLPDGPFTWQKAHRSGWSRHELDQLLADGTLRRVLRNVYDLADAPDTLESRAAALSLVATPFGVFCDRTAAWLHGIDAYEFRELEILPELDCVVLRGRHRIERPQCRGGERDLAPQDICIVNGLRVTTPLRTALDLACLLPRAAGLAVLDAFMRIYKLTRAMYLRELPRYRGRRGVVQLRSLIPLATHLAESPAESRSRLALIDAGIPAPRPQHWVHDHGIALFRLDLAWPKSRVAVEYDGEEWHDRTDEQREATRLRRRWLRDHGWTVIVLTKESFTAAALDQWLAEVRDALRLR